MPTKALYKNLNKNNLNYIIDVLSSGGIIIYPTETVWAIGCNSLNKKSIEKIYKIKRRRDSLPIISLLDNYNEIKKYANSQNIDFDNIIKNKDYPPTIIYPDCKNELLHLSNSKKEIAFRITPLQYLKKIICHIRSPLASTSANISGEPSPISFQSISSSILNSADLILNFDINLSGKPSSIMKINQQGEIQYIRK
tara:strand:- start:7761 stop:8348 length:588 start_codon:yes stop_codon:yes gene_type:complete